MTSSASSSISTTVARNIRAAREAKGWTQRDVASRVNDTVPMTVSRWERGLHRPDLDNLQALAAAFDLDVGWFYTDHTKEPQAA